jgi:purine-binding chemotaxis protein CheW
MSEKRKGRVDWNAVRARLALSEADLTNSMTLSDTEIADLYQRRAEQLARRHAVDTRASAKLAVLVFTVGKETYSIDLTELTEVSTYKQCTPIPDAPPALLGLTNVRGDIRAVLDFGCVVEVEASCGNSGYVLMVRSQGTVIGFKVDQIEGVRDLCRDHITFTAETSNGLTVRHVAGLAQERLRLIDTAGLMPKLMSLISKRENRSN